MAKMMKHLAKIRDSDARVLVVFMTIPDAEDHALVIQLDTLNDHVREELSELIATDAAQNEKDLGVFLKRKQLNSLTPGVSILDWMFTSNKLQKVMTKNVIMTPSPMVRIPLNELNAQMKTMRSDGAPETSLKETANKSSENHWGKPADEQRRIAENLLFEAKLLRDDAELSAKQKETIANQILSELGDDVKPTAKVKKAVKKPVKVVKKITKAKPKVVKSV